MKMIIMLIVAGIIISLAFIPLWRRGFHIETETGHLSGEKKMSTYQLLRNRAVSEGTGRFESHDSELPFSFEYPLLEGWNVTVRTSMILYKRDFKNTQSDIKFKRLGELRIEWKKAPSNSQDMQNVNPKGVEYSESVDKKTSENKVVFQSQDPEGSVEFTLHGGTFPEVVKMQKILINTFANGDRQPQL